MRDAFFEELLICAKNDSRVVFLTADHGTETLKRFQREIPDRYINVGIAEQNMIGVAAGLAASGKIVFVFGISPFVSLRVLEQLTIDVAAMQLPVNVVCVGAGFTYSTDGPTHHGLQDIPAILTIPNLSILNSSDCNNTRAFANYAVYAKKPNYIRIEKGTFPELKSSKTLSFEDGFSIEKDLGKALLVSSGTVIHKLVKLVSEIEELLGKKVSIVDLFAPRKAEEYPFLDYLRNHSSVYVFDESYSTSISNLIGSAMARNGIHVPFRSVCPKNTFYFSSGDRGYMERKAKIDCHAILESIIKQG